jgi:hypothetical protein
MAGGGESNPVDDTPKMAIEKHLQMGARGRI